VILEETIFVAAFTSRTRTAKKRFCSSSRDLSLRSLQLGISLSSVGVFSDSVACSDNHSHLIVQPHDCSTSRQALLLRQRDHDLWLNHRAQVLFAQPSRNSTRLQSSLVSREKMLFFLQTMELFFTFRCLMFYR
jgi:hypothetical protein